MGNFPNQAGHTTTIPFNQLPDRDDNTPNFVWGKKCHIELVVLGPTGSAINPWGCFFRKNKKQLEILGFESISLPFMGLVGIFNARR